MSIDSEKEQKVEEKEMMMKIKEELEEMRKKLESEKEMKTLLLKYDIPKYHLILMLIFILNLADSVLHTAKTTSLYFFSKFLSNYAVVYKSLLLCVI